MKKILVHYFSGTGNSLHAAKLITDELKKFNFEAVFHSIENGTAENIEDYDLHIFAFPIYATSVPHIMIKYINNLPPGKNAKAVVISTNGRISTRFRDGYQGWALHQARLHLKLKKYDVFFSDTLDYPHNIAFIPIRKEKYNRIILEKAIEPIPELAEKIANVERYHRRAFPLNFIWSFPFGILYTLIGRHAIGKLFVQDSKCNSCGTCAKECPSKTIKNTCGRMKWGWNCEGCGRCVNSCPKQAIQLSELKLAALVWACFWNPLFILEKYIPWNLYDNIGVIGDFLIEVILIFIFFSFLDTIIYGISKVPAIKRIVDFGHSKLYGRYRVEKISSFKN